jgi:tetratricopeptide (TPR) repeat protein
LTSCSDFIDLSPLAENSMSNFYKTEAELNQAVIATYDGVQALMRPSRLDHFGEVRSDNSYNFATTPNSGQNADFDNFNLKSSNSLINTYWHLSYQAIQRSNIVLNRIDDITMDENKKNARKGEVKFLRALTYFYLVQIWGDVPLVLEETTNPMNSIGQGRDPADEVYKQIIKDLEEAATLLPDKVENADDGRVTAPAAKALLARVYLVRKEYQKVIDYTNQVINSNFYSLDTNYEDIFDCSVKSKEVIFKIVFKSGTNSEGFPFSNVNHDYDNTASRDFMTTFKDDPRRDMNVAETGIATYYSKKIHNTNVNSVDNTIDVKIVILRYADILLMKAEALNKLSYPSSEALELLNHVRTRIAGITAYQTTDFNSQNEFEDLIINERRIELAFENLRWFDLLRTGKALEVMSAKSIGGDNVNAASALPYTIEQKNLLFPVPQTQIDASGGNLKQNPGY